MTDTDRATERLAEEMDLAFGEGLSNQDVAKTLVAQGFGHRDDHVRAFAEWAERGSTKLAGSFVDFADRHLASLAAKEEGR